MPIKFDNFDFFDILEKLITKTKGIDMEDLKSLFLNYSKQVKENIAGMKIGEVRYARAHPKTNYHYQSTLSSVVKTYYPGKKFKTKKTEQGLLVMRVS